MKVVIICQWFPPEYAPIGVMLHELAQDITNKGHKLTIITGFPNHPAGVLFEGYKKKLFMEEMAGGVKTIRCYLYTSPIKTFSRRILNYLTFALTSFVAALRLEKQDILFMVSPPLTNGVVALILSKLKGFNFVLNVQDIYPDAAISASIIKSRLLIKWLKKIELTIYRAATKVTVISEGFKENLLEKGVPESKISVIYNWIDTEEITPVPKDNNFARQHGLTDKFVVLYSGTIGMISGADILLHCAERISAIEDILILFVGEGVIKERIIKNAEKRRLKNVQFLPLQPREILSEVQSSSDVSVVTLLKGKGKASVPSKVLGYMAAAKPVLASVDVNSDTKKIIEKARCGICVDAEDAQGLTDAILQLYNDRHKAKALGLNGREFLLKHCERRDITGQYERLFLSISADVNYD